VALANLTAATLTGGDFPGAFLLERRPDPAAGALAFLGEP